MSQIEAISTLEAMKQALEALEYIDNNYMSLPKVGNEALKALEAALAKQEPVAEPHKSTECVGEPVAHIGITQFERLKGCGLVTTSLTSHKAFEDDIALYTTPQQRKPLTDEQIEACLHHVDEDGIGLFAFARAIEAAHGITSVSDFKE